jgi:hypothetical protein
MWDTVRSARWRRASEVARFDARKPPRAVAAEGASLIALCKERVALELLSH